MNPQPSQNQPSNRLYRPNQPVYYRHRPHHRRHRHPNRPLGGPTLVLCTVAQW